MLLQLDIKNYAIIDEVSVRFSDGLSVITGETGAGKSILLGALSLILGARAGSSSLLDKNNKAVIEGVFRLPENKEFDRFFAENQLDYAAETIMRREITPAGKSRSFINDTPVNLPQLSQLGALLVDLHQQFDTLQLGHADFQLNILDLLAGQKKELAAYQKQYQHYITARKSFEALEEKARQLSQEKDYDRFLLNELEEANFSEGELEELNSELQILSHSEDLKRELNAAIHVLETEESAAIAQLRFAQNRLESQAAFHKKLPDLLQRLSSTQIELQDIADELQQLNDAVEYDEERIAFIQERIGEGYRLLKKHNLQTTAELLALQADLQQKLHEAENLDENLAKAQKECELQHKQTQQLADRLTKGRQKQITPFIAGLQQLLQRVGMPNARMKVLLEQADLREAGQDVVSFAFDANKSGHFLPVKKVASGGELSRLMLCIKSMIAHTGSLPTLIFDEIESGISGEAARQVSLILSELAVSHQVICISHQPQIAGKADTHFQVFKSESKGRVTSGIRELSGDERVQIIAGMLSGDQPTSAALKNAKELMER